MTENNQIASWLRLIRTERIGPITFYQLINRFGTAEKAIDALPEISARTGKKSIVPYSLSRAQEELEQLYSAGGQAILSCDKNYPDLLHHIADPPPVLSVLGKTDLLTKPSIAMVGSRNASTNGCRLTEKLSRDLGDHGFVITSGLARGIDAFAHQGGLETGTIAVVAGGVNNIYPRQNTDLYHAIHEKGLIVSENPFNMQPRSIDFPRRNRVVSGLSQAIVVVEAALQSGSLISARLAAEQGREVFAIPGSPLDPRAKGTNKLIRDGATLIENADQIVEQLQDFTGNNLFSPMQLNDQKTIIEFDHQTPPDKTITLTENVPTNLHDIILEKLSNTPTDIDGLIRLTDHSPSDCLGAILDLELGGQITRHPGNKISRLYG